MAVHRAAEGMALKAEEEGSAAVGGSAGTLPGAKEASLEAKTAEKGEEGAEGADWMDRG